MTGKRVLVLGGTGMLGHKLVQVLSQRLDVWCTIRNDLSEISQYDTFRIDRVIPNVNALEIESVLSAIDTAKPDIVINAVGVVKQRPSSRNVVQTLTVNSIMPQLVGEFASQRAFRFISLSTDCVFSGNKGMYSEDDVPDATDLYGRSKQFGEVSGPNCLTLRTSIIGRELRTSHSLIEWYLAQTDRVVGYRNAVFNGFPTLVLSELIGDLIEEHPNLTGLFHVSSDPINKYELLKLVADRLGRTIAIESSEEPFIDRSLNSSRFRHATGFGPLPWHEMIDKMFADPTPYHKWRRSRTI